jgi:hypothetical protein
MRGEYNMSDGGEIVTNLYVEYQKEETTWKTPD